MAIKRKTYRILLKHTDKPEEVVEVEGVETPIIDGVETFMFRNPLNRMWYLSDPDTAILGFYWASGTIRKKTMEQVERIVNSLGEEGIKKRIAEAISQYS